MAKSRSLHKMVLWVIVFQLLVPLHLFADGAGKFSDLRGTVSLTRAGRDTVPQVDGPVFLKDLISTRERSRAKLLLVNDSIFSVASNSSVEITEALFKDGQGKGVISVLSGSVHSKILKSLSPGSQIEVRTPNAVAGARGTAWLTVVQAGSTEGSPKSVFYALEESISVANPEFPGQTVTVSAGQVTEVEKGSPPAVPVAFSIAAITGILTELEVFVPASGAGSAGGAAGEAAATGISTGTIAGIAAGVAAAIGVAVAATGGGGGTGFTPTHATPSHAK